MESWNPETELFCGFDNGEILKFPPLLRMAEVVTESYPQSILGIYIQVMIGPPEDPTAKIFQYIGITASLLSITKGCGEWWVRSRDAVDPGGAEEPKVIGKDAPL